MIFKERPSWIPSLDEQRRHAGDAEFRKAAEKALARFDRQQEVRAGLNSLRRCEQSLAELEKDGFSFHPELVRLAVDEFREKHRDELQQEAISQSHKMLADALAPHVRRCMAARKSAILADAAEISAAVGKVAEKYGAATPRLELVASLEAVAEQIDAELARGVDFSWHEKPRAAVSMYFTKAL